MQLIGRLLLVIVLVFSYAFLSILIGLLMGSFFGYVFSEYFAVWEDKTGLSMGEIGAMLGFISLVFSCGSTEQRTK